MKEDSITYRFLAIITVLAVLGSISLPVKLYAKTQMSDCCCCCCGKSSHKISPKKTQKRDMSMPSQHQTTNQSQKQGMDMAKNCCCNKVSNFNGSPLKSGDIALTTAQTKVILSATVLYFTAKIQPVDSPHKPPPPNLKAPPPPIFLVNSTFLN